MKMRQLRKIKRKLKRKLPLKVPLKALQLAQEVNFMITKLANHGSQK